MGGSKSNCGKSTYNPEAEMSLQTACLQCPANSVTNGTAATSPRHCTCIVGYYNMQLANETVECFQCWIELCERGHNAGHPPADHWVLPLL